MGCLAFVLCLLYIISPIDLWPGLLDDIACFILMIICCAKMGINPFRDDKPKRHDSDSDDSDQDGIM